jgi:hypothetical protein
MRYSRSLLATQSVERCGSTNWTNSPTCLLHSPRTRDANFEKGRLVFVVDEIGMAGQTAARGTGTARMARSIGLDAIELVVKTTLAAAPAPVQAIRKAKPISAVAQQALLAALASLKEPDPDGPEDAN